ncbi:relaxase (plasmid) [Agrobacterium sp. 13-2099-1-2]|uniref:LPD7 domain-containing protein n=1 Tax=Agrobacterium sp. 13-2099-1-2 TaxID=1841651 RepID=UPI00080FC311|nr:LPD7 domain-containing protein [Agrobacterium sp. 13-2099-1-2]UZX45519.1 relaxase [Agrobacterium sp. 13-2099-1-2]
MSEIFPGFFEAEWERQKAILLDDKERIKSASRPLDEELRKRGGGGDSSFRSSVNASSSSRSAAAGRAGGLGATSSDQATPRPVVERLAAVASGSQPAVIKMASYGGGARLGAMSSYVSRDGDIALENERGERLQGKENLAKLREEWDPLFRGRSDSRDIAGFEIAIDAPSFRNEADIHAFVQVVMKSGFGERHLAYGVSQTAQGQVNIEGLVVLRDKGGSRLSGDHEAAKIVSVRLAEAGNKSAKVSFTGFGNGVEYGTARLRSLVDSHGGSVRDERGQLIENAKSAGDLVQRQWRRDLHSRRGRDVMHVILSARAGTDADAFESAARDFLGQQFAGFKYVFAMHDPKNDPKEEYEGGKRPHIHIHALVVMRNEYGERITTSPAEFRQWRELLAEKARENGISMEMTDRRELASAPAFTKNQVRATNTVGRTQHIGTSAAAQVRYDAKRSEEPSILLTDRSIRYTENVLSAWKGIAENGTEAVVSQRAEYAQSSVVSALLKALSDTKPIKYVTNDVISNTSSMVTLFDAVKEGARMNELTAEDFPAYAEGVHKALDDIKSVVTFPEDMATFEALEKQAIDRLAAKQRSLLAAEKLETAADKSRPNSISRESGSPVAELSPMQMAATVLDGLTANVSEATKDVLKDERAEHDQSTELKPDEPTIEIEAAPEQAAKRTAKEIGTGEPEVDGEETDKGNRGFPAEISHQYYLQHTQVGTTRVFADSKATREVFQDAGEKLRTKIFDPTAVRLMVDTAAHRGWTSIEIKGSPEFRREAWLEGQSRGIVVKGYSPTELDWQEVTRREQAHLKNEIRHVEDKALEPRSAAPGVGAGQRSADASKVQPREAEVPTVAEAKGQSFREGVNGVLVEQGQKHYQDNPKNEQSNYVVLRTEGGDRTVWGVGIPDALYRADAKEGDSITLREAGMEKVPKTIIREVDGKKVKQEVMVDRRSWEAEVTERGIGATEPKKEHIAEVDTSSKSKTMVEQKQTSREGDASTTEPAKQQTNRLQQLRQEHEADKARGEQER